MRQQILFLMLCIFLFQQCYSQSDSTSKIVFYRERNFTASAVSFKTYVDDKMIIKLRNNSFYEHYCLPGVYDLSLDKNIKSKLRLNVLRGETYYLRFGLKIGFWSNTPELILVDSLSAYPMIYGGKMRRLDQHYTPLIRAKNRVGLNLNAGFGFKNIPAAISSNGDESKISFGGGIGLGLKYGREFGKHFDLAVDFNYQSSSLRPRLRNVDVSFTRLMLSVTPSYIIPIDGGETMRLKLGVGLDHYFGPKLSFDLTGISPGLKDEWVYKNSFGYHLNTIFELNIHELWTLDYGIKWYNVSYDLISTKLNGPGEINYIRSGKGSGLDLMLGLYYHF